MSFVTLHPEWETPLYQQLYQAIREAIESGALASGTRMPSIRRLPEELGVSRTTVEAAYQQLCVEGYLKSRPQRGYFVASARLQEKAGTGEVTVRKQTPPAPFRRCRAPGGNGWCIWGLFPSCCCPVCESAIWCCRRPS